jgi:hypothetical protein
MCCSRWKADGQTTSLFASAVVSYDALRIAASAAMLLGGGASGTAGVAAQVQAVRSTAFTYWGVSGSMALEPAGTGFDLYRAEYDVYAVEKTTGWHVLPGYIDGHTVNSTLQENEIGARSAQDLDLQV